MVSSNATTPTGHACALTTNQIGPGAWSRQGGTVVFSSTLTWRKRSSLNSWLRARPGRGAPSVPSAYEPTGAKCLASWSSRVCSPHHPDMPRSIAPSMAHTNRPGEALLCCSPAPRPSPVAERRGPRVFESSKLCISMNSTASQHRRFATLAGHCWHLSSAGSAFGAHMDN